VKNNYPQLTVLSDKDEIDEAQETLFSILTSRADKIVHGRVGFPGGDVKGEIYWISDLHFWYMNEYVDKSKPWYDPRLGKSRYWNAFGINKPKENRANVILCEINSPPQGINRRIGGAFAKDSLGNYYLIHRGNLGGYYSKKFFEENYGGEWTTVIDGDRKTDVVVIGPLNETLPERIRDFIYEIKQMKANFGDKQMKDFRSMIKKVLDEYLSAKEESFAGHPLSKLIRDEIPQEIKSIVGEDYIVKGSPGQANWANIPWIAIMDSEVTETVKNGYYVAYLFKENMEGVYLTLMQGVENLRNEYGGDASRILRDRASEFRSRVECKDCLEEISLTEDDEGHPYEDGIIYARYYPRDDLPDSDKLVSDLKKFLEIYMKLKSRGPFHRFLESKGFYFKPEIVENFLLSIKVKPFVILTGNSGTGKTKLAQLYGEYISHGEKRYLIVPVGANWTEKRHIFGYLNIITGKYQSTPALDFIMKAAEDPDNPYLLILDEMNLSHVERYFSDFLSAIESGEPVPLHDDPECDFPQEIKIPENLIVVGTVNVDETTYMFSPKVLDRANTIEFETINPKDYLNDQTKEETHGNLKFLENPLNHNIGMEKIKEDFESMDQIIDELEFFYKELRGPGFDFGFRVVNEILSFMHAAWIYEGKPGEWDNWERYFDAQIKQKILPKIHGPERLLRDTLEKLKEHCKGKFPNSTRKLEEMEETLKVQRYVSFIK